MSERLLCAQLSIATGQQAHRWKMQSLWQAGSVNQRVFEDWCKRVKDVSGARVEIEPVDRARVVEEAKADGRFIDLDEIEQDAKGRQAVRGTHRGRGGQDSPARQGLRDNCPAVAPAPMADRGARSAVPRLHRGLGARPRRGRGPRARCRAAGS